MARNELTLEEIKRFIDKIKTDLANKQGEMTAELKALKKDFEVDNLDAAYKLLDQLNEKVEDFSQERSSLMAKVTQKLEEFGYR
jgi:hypothetical protein